MGDRKRRDLQIVQKEAFSGGDHDPVTRRNLADGGGHSIPCAFGRVNGYAKLAAEHARALDMVAVLMRDQDRMYACGVKPRLYKGIQRLPAAHAAIDQQPAALGG